MSVNRLSKSAQVSCSTDVALEGVILSPITHQSQTGLLPRRVLILPETNYGTEWVMSNEYEFLPSMVCYVFLTGIKKKYSIWQYEISKTSTHVRNVESFSYFIYDVFCSTKPHKEFTEELFLLNYTTTTFLDSKTTSKIQVASKNCLQVIVCRSQIKAQFLLLYRFSIKIIRWFGN